MDRSQEARPTSVPLGAKQVGEVRSRWEWAEPSVWTDRMLAALETGVKGGVWFSLIDKVYERRNLVSSYNKVASNGGCAGVDHVSVERFTQDLERHLDQLQVQLREQRYHPQAIRRAYIPKPGSREQRPLGIPTVRDRVVQGALRHVLEPIFERSFAEHSYGFRPGRGCKAALRRVDGLLKSGYCYIVDADLKSYFDTIPHDRLMTKIREHVADSRVLGLIESFLKAGILEDLQCWTPESGAPQGAVISPLLSNVYLNDLDHLMARSGFEMTRYADDFIIQCRTQSEADRALSLVQSWVQEHGLTLHPTKTQIVHGVPDGFEFLGYRFENHRRRPRKTSLKKLRDTIRSKTHRSNGYSLGQIIAEINRPLRGWFAYFKHSHWRVFARLDSWIRMRLRSILRKRRGLRGRGRGRRSSSLAERLLCQTGAV